MQKQDGKWSGSAPLRKEQRGTHAKKSSESRFPQDFDKFLFFQLKDKENGLPVA